MQKKTTAMRFIIMINLKDLLQYMLTMALLRNPFFLIAFISLLSWNRIAFTDPAQNHLGKFQHFTLPSDQSLFSFTKNTLYPFFTQEASKQITLPNKFPLLLVDMLTPTAHRQYLWGTDARLWLNQIADRFRKAKLDVSGKGTKIIYDNTSWEIPIDAVKERTFVKFALFDRAQGVYSTYPQIQEGMVFLNYDNHNLRQYTVNGRNQLEDKTFEQLCDGLRNTSSELFYTQLLASHFAGYQKKMLQSLSPSERILLFDVGGIYMAEMFKTIHFTFPVYGKASGANTILPAILQYYFNQGGALIVKNADRYETQYVDCRFFMERYHERQPIRKVLEKTLTVYARLSMPDVVKEIETIAPIKDDNLFDTLTDIMESKTVNPQNAHALSEKIIAMLGEAAKKNKVFLNSTVAQANFQQANALKLLKLPPPPPLQPYY